MTRASSEPAQQALARYYDIDLLDDPGDVALYLALARRTGGPILELASGSGRVAVPLATAGFAVTAIDHDPYMLERARTAWRAVDGDGAAQGSLVVIEADLLDLALDERFGLVILALNGLLLMGDRPRQLAALSTMARNLRPDGLAAVDVWLPGPDDLALYDRRVVLEWSRDDPETGDRVVKSASATHDPATSTVTLTQLFDAWPPQGGVLRRVSRTDRMRLVGADELVAMAGDAGLAVEQLGGDYDMTPFGPGADRAVLVMRGSESRLV